MLWKHWYLDRVFATWQRKLFFVNASILARFWIYIIGMWDMLPSGHMLQQYRLPHSVNLLMPWYNLEFSEQWWQFHSLPSLFCPALLAWLLCFPEISLIACTEGYYLSSVSEFQLTWKNLDLLKLLVLPISEIECFPMLVKNMSNENGINTCNNIVNCSIRCFFLIRLRRIVELLSFTKQKTNTPKKPYFSFGFHCIFHIWGLYGKS